MHAKKQMIDELEKRLRNYLTRPRHGRMLAIGVMFGDGGMIPGGGDLLLKWEDIDKHVEQHTLRTLIDAHLTEAYERYLRETCQF